MIFDVTSSLDPWQNSSLASKNVFFFLLEIWSSAEGNNLVFSYNHFFRNIFLDHAQFFYNTLFIYYTPVIILTTVLLRAAKSFASHSFVDSRVCVRSLLHHCCHQNTAIQCHLTPKPNITPLPTHASPVPTRMNAFHSYRVIFSIRACYSSLNAGIGDILAVSLYGNCSK